MNHKVKIAIIQGVAALLCCAIVAVGGNSIADKLCENKLSIAEKSGANTGAAVVNTESGIAADSTDTIVYDENGEPSEIGGTEETDIATDDGTADTSGDVAAADGSSTAGTNSSTGSGASASASSGKTAGTGTQAKQITLTSGLTSTNKEEVLTYYRLVAKKNDSKTYTTKMTMVSLDGGSGFVGSVVSMIEPIAKKALEKNSVESTGIPGDPSQIKASDWKSAKAVNDGKYTTVTIQVVEQTDNAYGTLHGGTVGRSISVLDGVDRAMQDLSGVSADFDNGKFALQYTNAYIKFKVDNATGDFVKNTCEWHDNVNVLMDDLDVKIGIASAHLQGAKGVINYSVTY